MTELRDKNNGIKAKSKPSVCSDILRTPTNDCPAVNKTWTVFPLVFKGDLQINQQSLLLLLLVLWPVGFE